MTTNEQDMEALSALMDDEAQALELRRVLKSVAADPELRARWRRQQLARDLIRGRQVSRPDLDVSAAVQQSLSDNPGISRNPLVSMAVAASVTLAVVLGGQALIPADQVLPRTLISELGGNVFPVSGAQPVRASLETGAIPVAKTTGVNDEAKSLDVAARYERWAQERFQVLRQHHAAVASESQLVPYIARVRTESPVDITPTSE